MSGFKNFAIAGLGKVGKHIARELLKLKDEGKVDNVTILTRSVSSLVLPSPNPSFIATFRTLANWTNIKPPERR
jgi:hypothetical protein